MYIVIELQTTNGSTANIVTSHDTRSEAEAKYHSILSIAASSGLDCHSAVLLNETGSMIKAEHYTVGDTT